MELRVKSGFSASDTASTVGADDAAILTLRRIELREFKAGPQIGWETGQIGWCGGTRDLAVTAVELPATARDALLQRRVEMGGNLFNAQMLENWERRGDADADL